MDSIFVINGRIYDERTAHYIIDKAYAKDLAAIREIVVQKEKEKQEAKANEIKRSIKHLESNMLALKEVKLPIQILKNVQNPELDKMQEQINDLAFSLEQTIEKYKFEANKLLNKVQE